MKNKVIAIDGPAGAGKGTVAQKIAEKLSFLYIDTGAMYRAVTLYIYREKININDVKAVNSALKKCNVEFKMLFGIQQVFLNDENVSDAIRSSEISGLVAPVSTIPSVRNYLVNMQKKLIHEYNLVMEGRDIGTNVYPDADLKIFLTATVEERARRRKNQWEEKGIFEDFDKIKEDISHRDLIDSTRKDNPLKKAPDAILIESDHMTIDEVVDKIISLFNEREIKNGSSGE